MPPLIQAVFTITGPEYIQAMRRHYRQKLKLVKDGAASLLAIALGAYLVQSRGQSLGWVLIGLGVALLLMVIYAVWLMPILMYRYQPKLLSEYQMSFQEDGITFQTDQIHSQLQWLIYHSWLRDDLFYILYHGKRDLSVIPRRAFSSEADNQLLELLHRRIGPPVK